MKIRVEIPGGFHSFVLRLGLAMLLCAAFTNVPAWADCNVPWLTALNIPNMTIASTAIVSAAPPNPAYCDVKGSVATTGDGADPGSANFEFMLPQNWNGKFIFNGVGGLAGSLNSSANPADRPEFLVKGYATAVTDTGHLISNPTWGTPRRSLRRQIVDYFYRAVTKWRSSKATGQGLLPHGHHPAFLLRWLLEWRQDGPDRGDTLPG